MNHVTLEVAEDRMDEEIRFWELLGYREEEPYSDKYGARWIYRAAGIHRDRSQLHLFPRPDPIVPIYGHVAILLGSVGSIGRLLTRLSILGGDQADPDWTEGTRYWGTRRGMLRTPTGHRVELIEEHGPIPALERPAVAMRRFGDAIRKATER
jgi:catechol 2,3-dioxygenase-like lactoylglutathione lyase family enzyme